MRTLQNFLKGTGKRFVVQTVKKTKVILDNSPIHKSKKFKAKIAEWAENDGLIYFFPPYSLELRRIKYNCLSFDIYLSFQNLKERISYVPDNFGKEYDIIFKLVLIFFYFYDCTLTLMKMEVIGSLSASFTAVLLLLFEKIMPVHF